MPFVKIAEVKGTGNDTFTTGQINTAGANLLVATVSDHTLSHGVLTDSRGNDWIEAIRFGPFDPQTVIYYSYYKGAPGTPIDVGAGHDFTLTGTDHFGSVQVRAYSGGLTSADPLDQVDGELSFGSVTVQPSNTGLTPSEDGCLVVTHFNVDTLASPPTIDGGFSTPYGDLGQGSVYMGGYVSDLIQTTAALADPTWTRPNSTNNYASMAVFKPGVAGPSNLNVHIGEPITGSSVIS